PPSGGRRRFRAARASPRTRVVPVPCPPAAARRRAHRLPGFAQFCANRLVRREKDPAPEKKIARSSGAFVAGGVRLRRLHRTARCVHAATHDAKKPLVSPHLLAWPILRGGRRAACGG